MAALPNTGISISMVKAAIGAGTNDLGALFLHPNVNEWGFNCPNTGIQDVIWGADETFRETLSPNSVNYQQFAGYPPGYHLGNFRGYDHNWVVYQYNDFSKTGNEYYANMVFTYKIEEAAAKLTSKPNPEIFLQFKPQFRRTVTDSWIDLDMFAIHTTDKEATFNISAENPPDFATNGVLAQNEQFQIRVVIINPAARRWTEKNKVSPVLVVTTPTSAYTNTSSVRNHSAIAVKQTNPSPMNMFEVYSKIYADIYQGSLTITAQMSDTSGYTNTYYPAGNVSLNIPESPTPGTEIYIGDANFDFSNSGIASAVGVGSTVYYRIFINGVQKVGSSAIVTDTF